MKKSRKVAALLLALTAVGAMSTGLVACGGDKDPGGQEQTTDAEKLKDGGSVVFQDGKAVVDLSQYVKANGNEFRAVSSNPNAASVQISGSNMTITAVGEGTAIVTVSCGDVRITFTAVVPKTYYTVTLDGTVVPPQSGDKWESGSVYTLPAAKESTDPNMEFKGWSVNGETKQAGEGVTVKSNLVITAVFERKAAQEVSGHAQSVSLNVGKTASVTISDYILAYGREVNVSTDAETFVTFAKQEGVVTLTGVAQGEAKLNLSTEGITVEITVSVLSAEMPTFENKTIEIDLFTEQSKSVTFVPDEPAGHTYAYEYTLKTQDARAAIADGALTYTPGGDYDIAEDGGTVALTVEAAVTVDGMAAGSVTFTVTVRISDTTPAAPVFEDIEQTLDPFSANEEENSYTLVLKAEDENFTYTYEIGGNAVTGNKIYTEEADETVTVRYAYKGNAQKSGQAEFSVHVSYDRTAIPSLKKDAIAENIDLAFAPGGVYSLDLFANFTSTENIASYTVNGTAYTAGTEYTISNADSAYGETSVEVTYTVVATVKNNFGTLSYTYTVNVTDTSAFRMENGNFEERDENGKPAGWTGASGILSSNGTYWDNYSTNNEKQYYVGIDGGTETLVSPEFLVGGSGWVTFKFGSARPLDGTALRNIHLEFYQKGEDGGTDTKIADVRNILFKDPEAALKLNDYKLDLSAYLGKTVYVKAVDGEDGGDFRSLYLDAFETYWKTAPTDEKYTDLTAARYFNAAAQIDLKDTNTVTLDPVLSQGLLTNKAAFTVTVDKEGLTADAENPFVLTAVKSGTYTVTYKSGEETVFTASVVVKNTVQTPDFVEMNLTVKKGESGTLTLPVPETDSRFAYAYAVTESGASIQDGVLTYAAADKEEGTYTVRVTVTVTDTRWGANGDTFEKTLTVAVTVYGEKIVASDLLSERKATLALDVYSVKTQTPEATSANIDFAKYLIVPENVTVDYTVTRKIGDGQASPVALTNGAYALPFADCALTVNTTVTVVFEVTAANGSDESNTVSFTLTVSVKDTTENRVQNGGFETGDLTGWTIVSGTNADIIDAVTYWEGDNNMKDHNGVTVNNFMKDGRYFLHTNEPALLTLKSSEFILGGDGYISFKLGGARADVSYVALCSAEDDSELIKVTNPYFNDPLLPMAMVRRFMNASQYVGQRVYIKVVDGATEGFAMVTFDSLEVSLTQEEAQAILDSDKEWAASYRQDVLDNASSITGAHTVNIVNAIRNYYKDLTLPAAPASTPEQEQEA